MNTKNRFTH